MANGWGGARVGAGKKPRSRPFSIVGGKDEQKPPTPPQGPQDLSVPPDDLPAAQQQFWRECAPLAIERLTLTDATVPAFRLLCELHAKKVLVGTMVDKGALGGMRIFLQLSKHVETLMARFCLAPFGKPLKTEEELAVPVDNPWKVIGLK